MVVPILPVSIASRPPKSITTRQRRVGEGANARCRPGQSRALSWADVRRRRRCRSRRRTKPPRLFQSPPFRSRVARREHRDAAADVDGSGDPVVGLANHAHLAGPTSGGGDGVARDGARNTHGCFNHPRFDRESPAESISTTLQRTRTEAGIPGADLEPLPAIPPGYVCQRCADPRSFEQRRAMGDATRSSAMHALLPEQRQDRLVPQGDGPLRAERPRTAT